MNKTNSRANDLLVLSQTGRATDIILPTILYDGIQRLLAENGDRIRGIQVEVNGDTINLGECDRRGVRGAVSEPTLSNPLKTRPEEKKYDFEKPNGRTDFLSLLTDRLEAEAKSPDNATVVIWGAEKQRTWLKEEHKSELSR